MKSLIAAAMYDGGAESVTLVESLAASPAISLVFLIHRAECDDRSLTPRARSKARFMQFESFPSAELLNLLSSSDADYFLLILPGEQVRFGPHAIERLLAVAEDSGAGLVYSDFKDDLDGQTADHPLIDYQPGSVRDNFDFGSVLLIRRRAANAALNNYGRLDSRLEWGPLYDLRLKLSIDSSVLRVPEPLYTRTPSDRRASGERQFDYVDPRQRDYQREMELIATEHLKRIGAYLDPRFDVPPRGEENFPVRASVIIPVRNRERTIKDAVRSALSQRTTFDFNVIVVDNHSTDGTTEILSELARKHGRLVHLKPGRTDLGIGGCWNEAVYSAHCGLYAVQLDSDDLYSDEHALEQVVAKFGEGPYAMVIGSYTVVNFDLQEIPPGLIDHREWTRENGRNNALRINGLGAPRAFYVPVLRQIGLPNTSYGEDYGVALRISRRHEVGRIYESIYFARRWEGNSDSALPIATANRYDAYKDYLRTVEILARKRMNQR